MAEIVILTGVRSGSLASLSMGGFLSTGASVMAGGTDGGLDRQIKAQRPKDA